MVNLWIFTEAAGKINCLYDMFLDEHPEKILYQMRDWHFATLQIHFDLLLKISIISIILWLECFITKKNLNGEMNENICR